MIKEVLEYFTRKLEPKTHTPGVEAEVHIDGLPYPPKVNIHGEQRFPKNRAIAEVLIHAQRGGFNFLKLRHLIASNHLSSKEAVRLFTQAGLTVEELAMILPEVIIVNPLWEDYLNREIV